VVRHPAAALSARVIAVTAFEHFLEWVPDSDPRNWRRNLERHVDEWIEPLRLAKVPVRTVIVRDVHPVAAIADAARGSDRDRGPRCDGSRPERELRRPRRRR